jgi:HD-GYP domain-containing protein (c-di-GMP phosphodiesterase class II)
LPSDLQATPHPIARSFDDELPRARRAFAFGEEALRGLLDALRAGRPAELSTITTAAYALADSLIDNPHALLWIGRTRDADFNAANHGVKVALYLVSLARHLGLPRRQMAELAMVGLLADIGKVHVPQALLDKPGMLAANEFAQVKLHVRYSLDAVSACADLPDGVELGIGQHHERLDGSGYPGGLKGDEISLYGRMAAIADSFAALITPRAYAAAASPQDALMNLCEWAGSSFDEPLVEQFVQTVGMFPVGSLVELSSGEVARVVTLPAARLQRTRVLVLTEADKTPLERPREAEAIGAHESGPVGPSQAADVRIVAGLPSGSHGLAVNDPYAQGRVEPLSALG